MNQYIRNLSMNRSKRLPICFCIDCSGSMERVVEGFEYCVETGRECFIDGEYSKEVRDDNPNIKTAMDIVKSSFELCYEEIVNEEHAADACESITVAFNDKPQILDEFDEIASKKFPKFPRPKGNTCISSAIELCLNLLDERIKVYKSQGIRNYTPWLIIFTDGKSLDDVTNVIEELNNRERRKELVVYPFSLSNDPNDKELVRRFSIKNLLDASDSTKIKDAFKIISQYLSYTSSTGCIKYFNEWGIPEDF